MRRLIRISSQSSSDMLRLAMSESQKSMSMLISVTESIYTIIDSIVSMQATYSETYTDLMRIVEIASNWLRALGKIEGKNESGSEEELRKLVLDISKKIVENVPALRLEDDDIDHAEAVMTHTLLLKEDPQAFQNNDFEVTG